MYIVSTYCTTTSAFPFIPDLDGGEHLSGVPNPILLFCYVVVVVVVVVLAGRCSLSQTRSYAFSLLL